MTNKKPGSEPADATQFITALQLMNKALQRIVENTEWTRKAIGELQASIEKLEPAVPFEQRAFNRVLLSEREDAAARKARSTK